MNPKFKLSQSKGQNGPNRVFYRECRGGASWPKKATMKAKEKTNTGDGGWPKQA